MARILVEAFAELAPDAWPTIDPARAEVEEPDILMAKRVGWCPSHDVDMLSE